MATLYKLTDEYSELLLKLEEAETDEEANAVWEEIYGLEGDIVDKAEAYARILKNKQAEAEAFKAEKLRLADRQKAAENVVERLKSRLLYSMETLNIHDISTGIGKWYTQANPWSCEVVDVDAVPGEYHIPQPDKIDKEAILKHFKQTGEELPGTTMVQKMGVRFK